VKPQVRPLGDYREVKPRDRGGDQTEEVAGGAAATSQVMSSEIGLPGSTPRLAHPRRNDSKAAVTPGAVKEQSNVFRRVDRQRRQRLVTV
jgi:hypothetical protein